MTAPADIPRFGHFAVPQVTDDPRADYRAILDLGAYAETLGFDSLWVAEGRIGTNGLPSALAFLAALSQRTRRIALGTAVITLAFEEPVAVAETAAVVDALSGGRLELGLGKSNGGGWSSAAFHALALDEGERERLFADALARFREVLTGSSDGHELPLHPPTAQLAARLWQATSRAATAAAAGAAGDGLQIHRKSAQGHTGTVQSALVDAYLDALPDGATPRIAVSRSVLPASDRAEAVALLDRYARSHPAHYRRLDPAAGIERHLVDSYIAYGSEADIAAFLAADATVTRSTDILFSIPLPFDAPEYREALAALTRVRARLAPASLAATA